MKSHRDNFVALLISSTLSLVFFAPVCHAQVIVDREILFPKSIDLGSGFGDEVAISGNFAVVGASRNSDHGSDAGAASLFDLANNLELFDLTPQDIDAGNRFGFSVAIDQDTILVGAVGASTDGVQGGAAYIFDVATGQVRFRLVPTDNEFNDGFGFSVAVSGDFAIVGATGDDNLGISAGAVYVFDVNTGAQLRKLTASDGAEHDSFGQRVALSGNVAAVSAIQDDIDGNTQAGSVYIFNVTTGEQLHKLISDNLSNYRHFGSDIDIDSQRVIVADRANNAPGSFGSALVFDVLTGEMLFKLTKYESQSADYFASSVAIFGDTAIVGAPRERGDGPANSPQWGSAYMFDTRTGERVAMLVARNRTDFARFGSAIAISGDQIVIGATRACNDGLETGAAYIVEMPCPADMQIDGNLSFFDISAFLFLFLEGNLRADFNGDGTLNFFDVSIFLGEFMSGCP